MGTLLDTIKTDIESALSKHPELDRALADSAALAASPLAQTALELIGIPAGVQSAIAAALRDLDAALTASQPAGAAPVPTASTADASSPAAASGPAAAAPDPKAAATTTSGGPSASPGLELPNVVRPLQ